MKNYILECCVDSAESAAAAKEGGATRLELCSALVIGGLSPSVALFEKIRRELDIRIHTLLRPRFGDFCYTQKEHEIIRSEIRMFREAGADGVVIGSLKPDGSLDMEQMQELMEEAQGMSVTLHRAFDMCRDPFETLEQAKELGIDTILTSGQKNVCTDGAGLLAQLVRQADGKVDILLGAGIDASVIRDLYQKTGATSYHMSGKRIVESRMCYRRQEVSMGVADMSEYEIWRTDAEKVRAARTVLEEL